MLRARGLTKKYGDRVAVAGIDLDVAQGACYGLLGPNGAGKTTTISMLVGVLAPGAGTVELDGKTVRPTDPDFKRRVGYVPQDLALYDDLSAGDNLRFFGTLYGLSGATLQTRIAAALELANLSDRVKSRVSSFSGGMKRRLNIAAALLHDPDLIVLDEPTVGVDPQSRNAIFEALAALRNSGKTLVYTTHYMEEVERLCDRIAIMDDGRIVAEGTLRELQKDLAGGRRLTIETESNLEPALGALRALDGVRSVEVGESSLSLEIDSLERTLPSVLATLASHSVRYGALASDRLSLEEVFLQKTGRSLRD